MAYPPVSPYRGRFDDNPFEKFRAQRSDRGPLLGASNSTGFRSRKRHSKARILRYALLIFALFALVIYLWKHDGPLLRSRIQSDDNVPQAPQQPAPQQPAPKHPAAQEPAPQRPPEVVDGGETSKIESGDEGLLSSKKTHTGEEKQIGIEKAALVMLVR